MLRTGAACIGFLPFLVPFVSAQSSPEQFASIRTMVRLVRVPVTVWDETAGQVVGDLRYRDFEAFDNGQNIALTHFSAPEDKANQPMVVWLITHCGATETAEIRKAVFEYLNAGDAVGISHWCGAAQPRIDVEPTVDHDKVSRALDAIAQERIAALPVPVDGPGLPGAVDALLDVPTATADAESRVAVVLSDGGAELSKEQADLLAKRLTYRRVRLYALGREASPSLTSIAERTGGQTFAVDAGDATSTLRMLFGEMRLTYGLAFIPQEPDGRWHELTVRLAGEAHLKHSAAKLSYVRGYLNAGPGAPFRIEDQTREETALGLEDMRKDLDASSQEISVTGTIRTFGKLFEFDLRIGTDDFDWTTLPNGNRLAGLAVDAIVYSEQGEKSGKRITRISLIRQDALIPITGQHVFQWTGTQEFPEGVSRVRLVVTDMRSGKSGYREFSRQELDSAPQGPRIIR